MSQLRATPYTRQEAFDRVWDYFVNQKGEFGVQGATCAYRSNDGGRCAVGVLIEDQRMEELKLEHGAGVLFLPFPQIHGHAKDLFAIEDGAFYSMLQSCHDSSVNISVLATKRHEVFESRLRALAVYFNLEVRETFIDANGKMQLAANVETLKEVAEEIAATLPQPPKYKTNYGTITEEQLLAFTQKVFSGPYDSGSYKFVPQPPASRPAGFYNTGVPLPPYTPGDDEEDDGA